MSAFHYAERAARLLRAARDKLGPHPSPPAEVAIATLAGAIEGAASRRRRRRVTLAAATAGAICGALALGWALRAPRSAATAHASPEGTISTGVGTTAFVAERSEMATLTGPDGRTRRLLAGQAWQAGEWLTSDASPVVLGTGDRTTVEIRPRSELELVRADAERWLRLAGGAVSARVTKLKTGERFVIATPDAEVEVRGTRFEVALVASREACGDGALTRVRVEEGVVIVRASGGESRVAAGESWPRDCARPAASPAESIEASRASGPDGAAGRSEARRRPARPGVAERESSSASTLAIENDLLGSALEAERAGDPQRAARLLDALLTRFPGSPLRESAAVTRARLVAPPPPR